MKPVLFSVSYAGLWGQARLGLDEFVAHARRLGYGAVELMGKRPHLSPLDYGPAEIDALARTCETHGVEVACVAAYTNFAGSTAAEVPDAELQIGYVEALAGLARKLGCSLVRVFTSYEQEGASVVQVWDRTCEAIRECCDRAAACGVTIGIQNHHDIAVDSRALVELLADVDRPNCKLMFDPWSPCLRDEPDLFETAKRTAPHVVYTTLADYVRLPRYRYAPSMVNYRRADVDMVRAVAMGEGDLDSLAFLQGLKAGGYDGPAAYEMCSPVRGGGAIENLDRCARAFLDWLDEHDLR